MVLNVAKWCSVWVLYFITITKQPMITLNFISADIIDLQKISIINNGKIPILEGKELIQMPCTFDGKSITKLLDNFILAKDKEVKGFIDDTYICFLKKSDFTIVQGLILGIMSNKNFDISFSYDTKIKERCECNIDLCSFVYNGITFVFYSK